MSLILDHINGIHNDNELKNLRILCPNCNSTLPTHCRGNIKLNKQKENETLKIKKKKKHYTKSSLSQRKVKRPDYIILQNEIKNFGYSATGRRLWR